MTPHADPHRWLVLVTRYGAAIPDPTPTQLSDALVELFDPAIDDEEHGDAWLRYVTEQGPEYVLTITCHRKARFEEWAHADDENALGPPRTATVQDVAEALQLWSLLAAGDVDAVRSWRWKSGGESP